ncbi:MAG: hypothetical protein ICV60_08835 [Pyrinomonadaceae bacterium]|nr:hypothetical protein [Pyrinomonadaceae bacterium]
MRIQKQLLALLLTFIIPAVTAASAPDKMTAEDVIAKHVASIGNAEALAAARTRIAVGNAKALSHSKATRDISGVAQLASDGDKVLLAMIFNLIDYPYEKAGYDGQKMTVALLPTSGSRTSLGDFLVSHDAVFKQGLIGGVLSSAWPLLDSDAKKLKLSFAGTEKIDGREAYKLKYPPPKGAGDFQITLFFDAETFRHVRTEYQYVISNQMGARPSEFGTTNTGSQTRSRTKLVEEFSDFKTESSLTLPHTYRIRFTADEYQRNVLLEWVINFSQFVFNQQIDASAFNVSSGK